MGEFGLIKSIVESFETRHPRIIKSIGDDTAVTLQTTDTYLLTTTDTLVEDIHFSSKFFPPHLLGRKALSVSLSDIASMGGTPLFFLVSLSVPGSTKSGLLDELYRGFKECADETGVVLIGGNTAASPDKITISTTVLGEVPKDEVVYRNGACPGDRIFVTGTLGGSAYGLALLKDGETPGDECDSVAIKRYLDPEPRIAVGRALAKGSIATAMMDVSDGLVLDLRHIAEESNVGAQVELAKIPMASCLEDKGPHIIDLGLSGGEDYELLFTAPESKLEKINQLSKDLLLPITAIGTVMEKKDGVVVLDGKGAPVHLLREGYDHFKD